MGQVLLYKYIWITALLLVHPHWDTMHYTELSLWPLFKWPGYIMYGDPDCCNICWKAKDRLDYASQSTSNSFELPTINSQISKWFSESLQTKQIICIKSRIICWKNLEKYFNHLPVMRCMCNALPKMEMNKIRADVLCNFILNFWW